MPQAECLEARRLLAGDLIAHWLADQQVEIAEPGQGSWTDLVDGIQANVEGGPVVAEGVLNGRAAIEFEASDGVDGFRIPSANNPLAGANDFSVAVVFATDSTSLVGGDGPWFESTGLVDSSALGFSTDWGLAINASGQLSAGLGVGFGQPTKTLVTESSYNAGQLHTAVVTRQADTVTIYVDGQQVASEAGFDAQPRAALDLTLGMLVNSSNGFDGQIAQVRLYDGALTSSEVDGLNTDLNSYYNNGAPVAQDDTYSLNEDETFFFVSAADGVLANDSDPDGDALTPVIRQPPQHGTLTLNADGSFVYSPEADYFGTDTATYAASDFRPGNEATITFEIAPVYDMPQPVDDTFKLMPDETLQLPGLVGILSNDRNVDNAPMTAVLDQDVSDGELTLSGDGGFTYSPNGFSGTATFSYRINDGRNDSEPATVTFVVNTPPVPADDVYEVDEDATLSVPAAEGILANDVDADGNALTLTLESETSFGALELNPDGSLEYTPEEDFFGSDSFTYSVTDSIDSADAVTVTINVRPVNDLPTAEPDAFAATSNQLIVSASAGLLSNDSDIDGPNELSAELVTQPQQGQLNLSANGALQYSPNPGFRGRDSFTYRAHDGQAFSEPVEVVLYVHPSVTNIADPKGDSVVTFSELMYNPDGSQADLEWLELRNQMGIDVDLSRWALTEGIFFEFPEGTVIPGNGHLVIASDPEELAAATGYSDALGPFSGRLSNGGEDVLLINNSDRIMDIVDYDDGGRWPVGPDGSGATLAKRGVHLSSGAAENWTTSWQIGGTPGAENFPEFDPTAVRHSLIQWNGSYRLDDTGSDLPASWPSVDFDDSDWTSGKGILEVGDAQFPPEMLGGLAEPGEGLYGYWPLDEGTGDVTANSVDGGEAPLVNRPRWETDPIRGTVIRLDGRNDHIVAGDIPAIGVDDDFTWSFWFNQDDADAPNGVIVGNRVGGQEDPLQFAKFTPSAFEYYHDGADPNLDFAIPNGQWLHLAVVKEGPSMTYYVNGESVANSTTAHAFAGGPFFIGGDPVADEFGDGLIDDVALWQRALPFESIEGLASGEFTPSDAPTVMNPGLILPEGLDVQQRTEGAAGATTYYARYPFEFVGDPKQTTLELTTLLEDGAAIYVNGQQIERQNLPAGELSASTTALAENTEWVTPAPRTLPGDALRRGTNVLAVELHLSDSAEQDALLALQLDALVVPTDPASLRFPRLNEIAGEADTIMVELHNPHAEAIDLGGYQLGSFQFPEETVLDAGAYMALGSEQLGNQIEAGDPLFLMTPFNQNVADAQRVADRTIGRDPANQDRWFFPTETTPAAANLFQVNQDVVINELMYHAPGTYVEELDRYFENDEQWIELYNRSDTAIVDLSGWRVDDGIQFVFPDGATLAPQSYLVIAKSPDELLANRPALDRSAVFGPFAQNLSNEGENVQLKDAEGNLVDEVRYYESGTWAPNADGHGSSLELRDPFSDNSAGATWAASDETDQTSWQTVRVRGLAERHGNDPTLYNEFLLGLLDDGAAMIDDVSVIEQPGTPEARELIQNGTFEDDAVGSGPAKWRIIGTQHGRVIVDPDDETNQVLLLEATGPTEHMHNNAGTTLKAGDEFVRISSSTEYEISFRARHVSGSNQLNSRLYFNRLPMTTRLDAPVHGGTPGQPNSQLRDNIGPTYRGMIHTPAVPDPQQDVTVSIQAGDPQGISEMVLHYSVDGSGFESVPMTEVSTGRFEGTIPGQEAEALVQFYVVGQDGEGASSMSPAAGPESRALYRVQDNEAVDGPRHTLRILMTDEDTEFLHEPTNVMSNDRIGGTVIYRESEIYYDVGVRLKGSQRGRNRPQRVSFNVGFSPEQPFRDVHPTIGVDRSGSGDEYSQEEIIVRQVFNHAGNVPQIYDDLIHVIAPNSRHTGSAMLNLARYNDIYLDSQYVNGSAGTAYEYELIYYPTTTVDRDDPESLKLPNPDSVAGVPMARQGGDKELHRYHWIIENNRRRDEYGRLMEILEVLGLRRNTDNYQQRLTSAIDVDQWLRSFAVSTLVGAGDNYTYGSQHNAIFYIRPRDNRMLYLPFDMDFSFTQGPTSSLVNNNELRKFVSIPEFEHTYYGHVLDVLTTTVNSEYMDGWIDYFDITVPEAGQAQDFQTYKSWISRRFDRGMTQIESAVTPVDFEITTIGPLDIGEASTVSIEGTAWVDVREVRVQGAELPLTLDWTENNQWQANVPVSPGTHDITLEAIGFQGQLIGTQTIQVTSSASTLVRESLRVTELNFNPGDFRSGELAVNNDEYEFIELRNIGSQSINLDGVRFVQVERDRTLEGVRFAFDPISLAPNDWIVVARNRDAFVSRYGDDVPLANGVGDPGQFGVFSGQLANGGETLTLVDATGHLIQQFQYDDNWYDEADGEGATLELIDPARTHISDWNDEDRWRASQVFGGSPGGSAAGDANLDGRFDTADLSLVFQAGEYEDDVANNSEWAEGDWNNDGDFTSADLVLAFSSGRYIANGQLNGARPSRELQAVAVDQTFSQWRYQRDAKVDPDDLQRPLSPRAWVDLI